MKEKNNHTARVGELFNKELEFIKEKRVELGKDNKKRSLRELTNLLVKYDGWEDIKEEMINFIFENE